MTATVLMTCDAPVNQGDPVTATIRRPCDPVTLWLL